MHYLDVSPMISALRDSPTSFEFARGSLHHIPSRHRFQFDHGGHVRIDAGCDCSSLVVSKQQEPALTEAFQQWRADYWRPLEINRQFAAHFDPPSPWRKLLINLTERVHRMLLSGSTRVHADDHIAVPAE
jgi:hypothetical protein